MKPEDFAQQIEDFLLGRLNETERKAFEKALANDETLREEVAFRQLIVKGTKQEGRDQLKNRLKQIHEQVANDSDMENTTIQRKLWPRLIAIAASIVLLLVSGGYFFLNNEAFDPKVAYEEYYKAAPLRLASRDDNTEKAILQLNEYYNDKDYGNALPVIEKLLDTDSTNSIMQLAAGICHLELNQIEKARKQFLSIIKAQDFRLKHQANWYMALTYLKEGKLKQTQSFLNPIVKDSKADHHYEALELTKLLK